MSIVRVVPSEITLEVRAGETLIEAAWRQGWYWPTSCYGNAICSRCYVEVQDGFRNLHPPADDEQETLERVRNMSRACPESVRLACRLRLFGDAVVRKTGVVYVGSKERREA